MKHDDLPDATNVQAIGGIVLLMIIMFGDPLIRMYFG